MARKYHPHSDIIKTLILSMGISSHNWRALGTPMERAASLTQLGISDSSNVPNQGHMSLQLVGVTHGVHLAPATIVTPCLIGWYGPKSAVDQKTTPSNPLSPAAEPFIPAPPKSSLQSDFLGAHELAENPSADHQQISDSSSSGRAWNPVGPDILNREHPTEGNLPSKLERGSRTPVNDLTEENIRKGQDVVARIDRGAWEHGPPRDTKTSNNQLVVVSQGIPKPNVSSGKTKKSNASLPASNKLGSEKRKKTSQADQTKKNSSQNIMALVPSPNDEWQAVSKKKAAKLRQSQTLDVKRNDHDHSESSGTTKKLNKNSDEDSGNEDQTPFESSIQDFHDGRNLEKSISPSSDSPEKSSTHVGNTPQIQVSTARPDEAIQTTSIIGLKKMKEKKKGKSSLMNQGDQLVENLDILDTWLENNDGRMESTSGKLNTKKKSKSKKKKGVIGGSELTAEEEDSIKLPDDMILFSSNLDPAEKSIKKMFEDIFLLSQKKSSKNDMLGDFLESYRPRQPLSSTYLQIISSRKLPIDHMAIKKYQDLWEKNGLEVSLMSYLSVLLKVQQREEYVGIGKIDSETSWYIFDVLLKDEGVMIKIYKFMELVVGGEEAFRRMVALCKQLIQTRVSHIREYLKEKKKLMFLFEGSTSGEYEKTFDMLGHYGLNMEGEGERGVDVRAGFYKESEEENYNQVKYGAYEHFCGENETAQRSSPRLHVEWEEFSKWIDQSHYRKAIQKEGFIEALECSGLNLNRVLTVVLILGLEESHSEEWLANIKDNKLIHYMSKILYKVMVNNQYNPLPWINTAERHWLLMHYPSSYTTNLSQLITRLKRIKDIRDQTHPAVYDSITDKKISKIIMQNHPTLTKKKYWWYHFLATKYFSKDVNISIVESLLPKVLATRLKSFEPVL